MLLVTVSRSRHPGAERVHAPLEAVTSASFMKHHVKRSNSVEADFSVFESAIEPTSQGLRGLATETLTIFAGRLDRVCKRTETRSAA